MKEKVALNKKERRRLMVLNGAERDKVIPKEGAEVLDLSLRQLRRLFRI